MLLTWEDGYCDDTELRDFDGRMRDDVTFTNENDLFSIGGTIDDVHYAGYPIGLAVADMRYLQYLLGEGVVGKVAYTGSHCWVFCDNLLSGVFTSNLVPECPDEWLVQLTAGVKTILLVPVVPHGVLQLGSFDKVSEDPSIIAHIRETFRALQILDGSDPFLSNEDVQAHSSLSITTPTENLNESSAIAQNIESEELLRLDSTYTNSNMENPGETNKEIMSSGSIDNVMELQLEDKVPNSASYNTTSSLFNFPIHGELHKAMGPAFQKQINGHLFDFVSHEDTLNMEFFKSTEFSHRDDSDYLLEAVVANVVDGCSDTTSNKSNDACVNDFKSFSNSASSFQNVMSTTLVDDTKHEKEDFSNKESSKGGNFSNISRRRVKKFVDRSPKTRPRDRQMIQDRVKELRELVPHGGKCSIDALLERTVKHMLFLRNVTNQAEKWRQWVHQGVDALKNRKPSATKTDPGSGTSWGFELGSQLNVCPIVVEDLKYPGLILIEMLCNQHGFFLEIVQVIRRLDLNILKGVMESRSNNTWAQFIVEVPRGFHRLDVFWPLMQLLQRTTDPTHLKKDLMNVK